MTIWTILFAVTIGALCTYGVFVYMQRNKITVPTPAQMALVVDRVIWAIEAAQVIYGMSGPQRAQKALEFATKELKGMNIGLSDESLAAIIKLVFHTLEIKQVLPEENINRAD